MSREKCVRDADREESFMLPECSTDRQSETNIEKEKTGEKEIPSTGGKVQWVRMRPELGVKAVRTERRGQDSMQGTVGQGLGADKLGAGGAGQRRYKESGQGPWFDLRTGGQWSAPEWRIREHTVEWDIEN